MTTRKRTTYRDVQRQLADPPRPVVGLAVDVRLTAEDLGRLSTEQIKAIYAGIGSAVAQGAVQ